VERYSGQPLPENPRIAVIANDAIGNWVMGTPLLQMLRLERKPSELHMFCGTRTSELQKASDLADEFVNLHGLDPRAFLELMAERRGQYDLVVNVESTGLSKTAAWILGENGAVAGPCLGRAGRGDLGFQTDDRGRLWQDKGWVAGDLSIRYPFLRSGFISEIFARLCYLESALPLYAVPIAPVDEEIPDVLISASASLEEKLWPVESWIETTNELSKKGLRGERLGAKPSDQAPSLFGAKEEQALLDQGTVEDLRGRFSLPGVVGALSKANLVLTLDNGILHLAVAAGAQTVGIYRHGIHRLWAPPYANLTVITPGDGNPVRSISAERIMEAIDRILQ